MGLETAQRAIFVLIARVPMEGRKKTPVWKGAVMAGF